MICTIVLFNLNLFNKFDVYVDVDLDVYEDVAVDVDVEIQHHVKTL